MLKTGEQSDIQCPNCKSPDTRLYQSVCANIVVEVLVCPRCAATIDLRTMSFTLPGQRVVS